MQTRVLIHGENVEGTVVEWFAHVAAVQYTVGGIEYKVFLPNEDFDIIEIGEND